MSKNRTSFPLIPNMGTTKMFSPMAGLQNCGLKVLQWNCNGLIAHLNEFKHHLSQNLYDVICLQETFLKPNKNFSLTGFSVVRRDRTDSQKGGLITLIRDSLKYTEISSPDNIECIIVNIKTDNSHITVSNVYISPDHDVDTDQLSKIFNSKTVIVGDLNSKNTLWGSPITDQRGRIIEKLLDDYNFVTLNNGQPTYTHYNGTCSHLDLSLICYTLGTKSYWEVLNDTLGSDHFPTITHIDVPVAEDTNDTVKFIMSKADWISFKTNSQKLLTVDLISESRSADENTDLLTNAITTAAELSIPQHKNNKRKRLKPLPYWNEDCRNAIRDRNKARNAMHKNKTLENCIKYRRLKGKAQQVIKSTAREYWQNYCNTIDRTTKLGTVWRMAKKMNGIHSERKITNLTVNGSPVETNDEKAELFAKTFSDISSNRNHSSTFLQRKKDIESNHKHLFENTPEDADCDKLKTLNEPFDLHELRRALREVKKHSAPGADRITYEMLQKLPKCSIKAVLKLFNRIWLESDFPVSWRHSIVLPVLKPGKDPLNPASYRPISLTSALCKLMEKLVTNRLTYFVEKHNILNNIQCGFRKGRSTLDHITRLQDAINKYNNNKGYTVGVFIDFQSAFDMMWQTGLLVKLQNLGITGNVFTFIKNFLTDRTIQVKVGNALSRKYLLENGTAQGSIISPLLFLLMINDLPENLQDVESSLFADDSCVFKSGRNLNHIKKIIQENLKKISDWCNLWGFKISLDKTVAVVFTHRKVPDIQLSLNNQPVKMESKAKFLGLIFDSRLNWHEHITYLEQKCKKRLHLLRAVAGNSWGANKKVLLTIYRALIRSVLDYGSVAYNSASDNIKKRLDVIQHNALRIACGAFCSTAVSALQVETGEMPLTLRRAQQETKYAVKVKVTEGHPAKSVTEFHWTTLSKKFRPSNLPIYSKTEEYFRDRSTENINAPVLPDEPPWHLKACRIDAALINCGSKHENPQLLKNLALEKIDSYKNSVHVYTDASKTIDNKASAAFCVPELKVEHSVRLSDNITIFAAELCAIKLALHWVTSNSDKNITIYSDSYSSLQAIASGKSMCRPNLLVEVIGLITRYPKHVNFVWLPSHIGIKGNELADRLANAATLRADIDVNIGLELSDAYTMVDSYILGKWQKLWDQDVTGSHYRTIEKTISTKIKYLHPSRHTEVIITRLRLGKCWLNAYLHQIGKHQDGLCHHCNRPETISHFLTECTNSVTCAAILADCKKLNINPSVDTILSDSRLHKTIVSSLQRRL